MPFCCRLERFGLVYMDADWDFVVAYLDWSLDRVKRL